MQGQGVKIRQGGPDEEANLAHHLIGLAPSARQCQEAGQLTEVLIMLGHEADARKLQNLLSDVIALQHGAAVTAHDSLCEVEKVAEGGRSGGGGQDNVDWKWDILRPVKA